MEDRVENSGRYSNRGQSRKRGWNSNREETRNVIGNRGENRGT